jgi:hypothetical protein
VSCSPFYLLNQKEDEGWYFGNNRNTGIVRKKTNKLKQQCKAKWCKVRSLLKLRQRSDYLRSVGVHHHSKLTN